MTECSKDVISPPNHQRANTKFCVYIYIYAGTCHAPAPDPTCSDSCLHNLIWEYLHGIIVCGHCADFTCYSK
jgi:hypothetical protein